MTPVPLLRALVLPLILCGAARAGDIPAAPVQGADWVTIRWSPSSPTLLHCLSDCCENRQLPKGKACPLYVLTSKVDKGVWRASASRPAPFSSYELRVSPEGKPEIWNKKASGEPYKVGDDVSFPVESNLPGATRAELVKPGPAAAPPRAAAKAPPPASPDCQDPADAAKAVDCLFVGPGRLDRASAALLKKHHAQDAAAAAAFLAKYKEVSRSGERDGLKPELHAAMKQKCSAAGAVAPADGNQAMRDLRQVSAQSQAARNTTDPEGAADIQQKMDGAQRPAGEPLCAEFVAALAADASAGLRLPLSAAAPPAAAAAPPSPAGTSGERSLVQRAGDTLKKPWVGAAVGAGAGALLGFLFVGGPLGILGAALMLGAAGYGVSSAMSGSGPAASPPAAVAPASQAPRDERPAQNPGS